MGAWEYTCRGCPAQPRDERWDDEPCPSCGGFWSIVAKRKHVEGERHEPLVDVAVSLADVRPSPVVRISTGLESVDRVLGGGGIPRGGLALISGPPGSGKSTLLAAICRNIAQDRPVLYVSGEEQLEDIQVRVARLGAVPQKFRAMSSTDIDAITDQAEDIRPAVMVVDAISVISGVSGPSGEEFLSGSVSSMQGALDIFRHYAASEQRCAFFIVCHVTKDGDLAGPRKLAHMVGAALEFEPGVGDERWLRCREKSRFGRVGVSARFKMGAGVLTEWPEDESAMQQQVSA